MVPEASDSSGVMRLAAKAEINRRFKIVIDMFKLNKHQE